MKANTLPLLAALIFAGAPVLAQDKVTTDAGTINAETTKRFFKEASYSPYAGRNFPDRPLWGDQHLHTTGPRITVRFFGGWEFTKEDASSRQPAEARYAKGVPMGGDLYPALDHLRCSEIRHQD